MMLGFTFKRFCETYRQRTQLGMKASHVTGTSDVGDAAILLGPDTHYIFFIQFHYIYLVI